MEAVKEKKVRVKEVKPIFVEELAKEVMKVKKPRVKKVAEPEPMPSPSKLVESATEVPKVVRRGRPVNPNSKRQQRLMKSVLSPVPLPLEGGNMMVKKKGEKIPKRMM